MGPVYRIRCNPFWANDNQIFLTCSYDWTVRLWNAAEQTNPNVLTC